MEYNSFKELSAAFEREKDARSALLTERALDIAATARDDNSVMGRMLGDVAFYDAMLKLVKLHEKKGIDLRALMYQETMTAVLGMVLAGRDLVTVDLTPTIAHDLDEVLANIKDGQDATGL